MNTEELRRVAEAATPGEWRYLPHSVDCNYMRVYCSADPSEGDNLRGYCGESNARHIAAFNPKTAIDLLDRLAALEAENAALKADAERYRWLREQNENLDAGVYVGDESEAEPGDITWIGCDLDAFVDEARSKT